MKIFFPFAGSSIGGSHNSILQIINNLNKEYKPIIIYHKKNKNFQTFIDKYNLKSIFLPLKKIPAEDPNIISIFIRLIKNYFKINKFIKLHKPDIIHCNDLGMCLMWSFANIFNRKKIIWHQRTLMSNSFKYYFINFLNCIIICNSYTTFNSVPKFLKNKKYVIYNLFDKKLQYNNFNCSTDYLNFIDTSKKNKKTILCYMGRIEIFKNIDLLIELLDTLLKTNKDFSLVFVGPLDDKVRFKLNLMIKQKNLDDFIFFTNFVLDPLNYVSLTDICIFPSNIEAFGRNAMETLSLGMPIIVSDSGAYSEFIVDGHNGLIFKKNNINNLIEKINSLINDTELKKNIKVEAKKFYKKFTDKQDGELKKLLNIYHNH